MCSPDLDAYPNPSSALILTLDLSLTLTLTLTPNPQKAACSATRHVAAPLRTYLSPICTARGAWRGVEAQGQRRPGEDQAKTRRALRTLRLILGFSAAALRGGRGRRRDAPPGHQGVCAQSD